MAVFGLFDVGSGELLLILVIALIVFGPKQLPEIARGFGKTLNEFKRQAAEIQRQINKELDQTRAQDSSDEKDSRPKALDLINNPVNHSPEAPLVPTKADDGGDPT